MDRPVKSRSRFSFLAGYYWLLVFLLYLPIGLLILFSFNNSPLLVFPLKGFTWRWYESLLGATELINATRNSLILGLVSSLAATILGTLAAIAITRFNFLGKRPFLAVASLPLVIPYVVLAVGLLILFDWMNMPLSLWTVGLGHVVINLPFVMLIVAARLAGFDPSLEEAAMDLGAPYWKTLTRVTIPIAMPALVSAFLLSFTTSFDEFALAFFLIGNETTLPVYLYSQLRFPSRLPLVVALAALIMVASILLVVLAEWLRRFGQSSQKEAVDLPAPAPAKQSPAQSLP